MREIVNGLLLRGGKVLMARRSASRRDYPGTWSFPGGHVEQGESHDKALKRELAEEIGISAISTSYLMCLQDRPAGCRDRVAYHLYTVDDWEGEPANLGGEHSELTWVDLDCAAKLPDLALRSYRDVLARLTAR